MPGHDEMGKRKRCKKTLSDVVVRFGREEAFYSLYAVNMSVF